MNAKAKADRLADALESFRKKGRLVVLSTAPEYPDYLVVVRPEDESADVPNELLKQAFDERSSTNPDWTLLAKTRSPFGRSAVYEYDEMATGPNPPYAAQKNSVYQITDVAPKRQITSVVGRIGAVTILARNLAAALLEIDPSLPDGLSTADLARLATHNTPDRADGVEKLLRRSNEGSYVTEQTLETAAQALCVAPRELAFNHPAIYAREARERWRQHRKRKSQNRLHELASYPVNLERLAGDRPELMARVVQLQKAALLQFRSELSVAVATQVKESAVAAFTNAVFADPSTVGDALATLHAAGLNAWFGEYDDRAAIGPQDIEFNVPFVVRAKTIRKGIVAFRELSRSPPLVTVDLSHCASLRPTLEDIKAQLT